MINKPLDGIRILDLTRVLAGPYCTMILHRMGAEVIKVERPGTGDDSRQYGPHLDSEKQISAYFNCINWGKKSLTLNLKSATGRSILLKLAAHCDVVVENFRPGTLDKMGLTHDAFKQVNPGIIFASASGFGQTGPLSTFAAYDIIVQALSGLMSVNGEDGGDPVRVGESVADVTTGIFTALGILAALYRRDRRDNVKTDMGAHVDVAMLDTMVSILVNHIPRYSVTREIPKPIGTRHPSITPFQDLQTQDSKIIVAVGNQKMWIKFLEIIERQELQSDPRFCDNGERSKNTAALTPLLNEKFREKTTMQWLEILLPAGIPCARINTLAELFELEQIAARDMLNQVSGVPDPNYRVPGNPIKFLKEDLDDKILPASPKVGQHTEEIIGSLLGLTKEEIQKLQDEKAI